MNNNKLFVYDNKKKLKELYPAESTAIVTLAVISLVIVAIFLAPIAS